MISCKLGSYAYLVSTVVDVLSEKASEYKSVLNNLLTGLIKLRVKLICYINKRT